MSWRKKGEAEWHKPETIQGIVLRRAGSSTGEFRRIGAFVCEQSRMEDDASDDNLASQKYLEFMRILEKSGSEVARSVCANVIENAERPREIFAIAVI
jgi:hypothetical protein